jgi:mannose-6-phosphate isomerase-like protein (cupin superfamily)
MTNHDSSANPSNLEALHLRAEASAKPFSYLKPEGVGNSKGFVRLGRTDHMRCNVQIVKKSGGENNLHYHTNIDSFWFVLNGRVRFYGPGDVVTGELGPMEGTFTPAYSRYWFENIGDGDLELLHVMSLLDQDSQATGRTDVSEQRRTIGTGEHFNAQRS